jgi:hypothetical protein
VDPEALGDGDALRFNPFSGLSGNEDQSQPTEEEGER